MNVRAQTECDHMKDVIVYSQSAFVAICEAHVCLANGTMIAAEKFLTDAKMLLCSARKSL